MQPHLKTLLFAVSTATGLMAASSWARSPEPTERAETRLEDNLPDNIRQLTWFGERASWSPDGSRIAFMSKSFGDAFEIDLATRNIRLLTQYPHPGYLRVQYLLNGDYLLVGSRNFKDIHATRYGEQELWLLKAGGAIPATPLEQKMTEGVAISRDQMTIAYAVDSRTHPREVPDGEAAIFTADIVYDEKSVPRIVNRKEVVRVKRPDCVGTEPQDFRNKDSELIFVCYSWTGAIAADIRGVNLMTGEITIYRDLEDEYNEVEGIFPNGKYTLVESSRDQTTKTSKTIDIWKLRLEPGSDDMTRLTRWGDYPGYKASNPVVSPDGSTIAFQSGRSTDEAGVGYGIFLLRTR